MTISLRDYDFARAEARVRAAVDRDAGTAYQWDETKWLRDLRDAEDAVGWVETLAVGALTDLRPQWGGLRPGDPWPVDHALVRLLRRVQCHPSWRAAETRDEERKANEVVADAGPLPWDVRDAIADLVAGIRHFVGDLQVTADGAPWNLQVGTVNLWMRIFSFLIALDEFGAFDPGFTRGDALAGDVWLLQPVSPRINTDDVAARVGLHELGYLPPQCVDVPGRVVMVCIDCVPRPFDARVSAIEDSKWISGWAHVRWRRGELPVGDPDFKLIPRLDLPAQDSGGPDRFGPYRHSSDLPRFPPPRWPWDPE